MSLPTLQGRGFLLSDGVELQYSKTGTAYARLPLSFRNSRKGEDGQWTHDRELKVEATVFGALAEALTDAVDGRVELAVVGEPYFETWTDKNGAERTSLRMIATSVWPVAAARRAKAASSSNGSSGNFPF